MGVHHYVVPSAVTEACPLHMAQGFVPTD